MRSRPVIPDPEKQQLVLLVKHFLNRFTDNELVPQKADMRLTLIHILALLATPGLLISFNLISKYATLSRQPAWIRERALLDDKLFFIYFSMVCMGFITAFEWDALFPDRRDYHILAPLPIREKTLFMAKVGALCLFLILFSVDVNIFSTVLFPLIADRGPLHHTMWWLFTHAVTILAANAFAFFFVVSMQGLLMNLFGPRAFKQISRLIQFGLIVFILAVFFLMPRVSFEALSGNETLLNSFPPAWFLGLYETLLSRRSVPGGLADRALTALALTTVTFVLTYVLSYKRHVKRSLDIDPAPGRGSTALKSGFNNLLHRFILRDPNERAAFYFIAKTLARSQRHRVFLGAYLGTGVAFVAMGLVTLIGHKGYEVFDQPHPALLSIPHVLSFFSLVGMRVVFAFPAEIGANWIFKLAERRERIRCIAGVRKAMLLIAIVPVFAGLFPFYVVFWGWNTAVLHGYYALTMALLLTECLICRLNKVPFTCSYLPGRANLKLFWFLYLFSFTTYAYTMTELESWMLQQPARFTWFYGAALALLAGLAVYRNRSLGRLTLIYEEDPGPAVQILKLIG